MTTTEMIDHNDELIKLITKKQSELKEDILKSENPYSRERKQHLITGLHYALDIIQESTINKIKNTK